MALFNITKRRCFWNQVAPIKFRCSYYYFLCLILFIHSFLVFRQVLEYAPALRPTPSVHFHCLIRTSILYLPPFFLFAFNYIPVKVIHS